MMTSRPQRAILVRVVVSRGGSMRLHGREDWARIRTAGRAQYLLRYGVVGRGLPMGILVALLIELWDPSGAMPDALLEPRFLGRLLLAVAVFAASGCVSALANWRLHERRFGGEDDAPPAP